MSSCFCVFLIIHIKYAVVVFSKFVIYSDGGANGKYFGTTQGRSSQYAQTEHLSFNSSYFWFNSRSFSEIRSFSLLFEALFDCYAGSISVFTVSELASTVVDEVICFSSTCFLLGFQKLMVLIIFSGSSFTL